MSHPAVYRRKLHQNMYMVGHHDKMQDTNTGIGIGNRLNNLLNYLAICYEYSARRGEDTPTYHFAERMGFVLGTHCKEIHAGFSVIICF